MKTRSVCFFVFLLCIVQLIHAGDGTKVIAHRGYWKTEGSAQNSLMSIEKAGKLGVYGSEFDVLMAYDGIPMVNHNNDYQGKHIESTSSSVLRTLKLSNNEALPTLEEYIIEGKKYPKTKMILELKPHSSAEKDIEAAHRVVALVQKMKARDQVEYITFSLTAGKELIRLDPEAKVAYLNGELSPKQLKELGFSGLDYHYNIMKKHPEWFKDAKDLGLTVNVWTVNTPELIKEMIDSGADYITTDEPELVNEIIGKKK